MTNNPSTDKKMPPHSPKADAEQLREAENEGLAPVVPHDPARRKPPETLPDAEK